MNDLVERLKAQADAEARQLRKARPLWLLAAGLFSLAFLGLVFLPPTGIRPARVWLGGVLAAVFLLDALLLSQKLRLLTQIDYTESVCSFLEKAERRLQFMRPQDGWLAVLGLVILGAVSGFYVMDSLIPRYVGADWKAVGLVVYVLGYLALCAIGFFLTYRNWKVSKAPLLGDVRKLKHDMAADETGGSAGATPHVR